MLFINITKAVDDERYWDRSPMSAALPVDFLEQGAHNRLQPKEANPLSLPLQDAFRLFSFWGCRAAGSHGNAPSIRFNKQGTGVSHQRLINRLTWDQPIRGFVTSLQVVLGFGSPTAVSVH